MRVQHQTIGLNEGQSIETVAARDRVRCLGHPQPASLSASKLAPPQRNLNGQMWSRIDASPHEVFYKGGQVSNLAKCHGSFEEARRNASEGERLRPNCQYDMRHAPADDVPGHI